MHTRKLPRLLQSLRTLESSFTFCNRYSNLPRNNRVACTRCYTAQSFQQCLVPPFCTSLYVTSFWHVILCVTFVRHFFTFCTSFWAPFLVRHFVGHFSTPFLYILYVIFGAILVRHFVRHFSTPFLYFLYLILGAIFGYVIQYAILNILYVILVRQFWRHFGASLCTSLQYAILVDFVRHFGTFFSYQI